MCRWARQGVGAVCLLCLSLSLAGCANVKVHKVDLHDRMTAADDKVKGFRYYLTRPYLVVASRVMVSRSYIPVWVAIPKGPESPGTPRAKPGEPLYLVSAIPDDSGRYPIYDQAGHLTPLRLYQVSILTGQVIPVDNKTKPDSNKIALGKVLKPILDLVASALDGALTTPQDKIDAQNALFDALNALMLADPFDR